MSMRVVVAIALAACSPSTPTPAQQAAVASEGLEDKACVDGAQKGVGKEALQKAIDECRAKVHAKYSEGGTP